MPWTTGAVAAALLLWSCSDAPTPSEIAKFCVSESGESRYYVSINLAKSDGQLRYQYFGQDILYRAGEIAVDGSLVSGTAYFDRAATGEVRGNPVEFEFDLETNLLRDGAVNYRCEKLQDPRQLDLPLKVQT